MRTIVFVALLHSQSIGVLVQQTNTAFIHENVLFAKTFAAPCVLAEKRKKFLKWSLSLRLNGGTSPEGSRDVAVAGTGDIAMAGTGEVVDMEDDQNNQLAPPKFAQSNTLSLFQPGDDLHLDVDIGNLCVLDSSQAWAMAPEGPMRDAVVREHTQAAVSLLFERLAALPPIDEPPDEFDSPTRQRLPPGRELLPMEEFKQPRKQTKWQTFAQEKGIRKRRSVRVWDPARRRFVWSRVAANNATAASSFGLQVPDKDPPLVECLPDGSLPKSAVEPGSAHESRRERRKAIERAHRDARRAAHPTAKPRHKKNLPRRRGAESRDRMPASGGAKPDLLKLERDRLMRKRKPQKKDKRLKRQASRRRKAGR